MINAPPVDSGGVTGSTASLAAPPAAPLPQSVTPELTAAALDRVDIQPLDLVGALLILIAEVRAGLPLPLEEASPGTGVPGTAPAPQWLVRRFLDALADDRLLDVTLPADEQHLATVPNPPSASENAPHADAWSLSATRLESALAAALNNGVTAVSAWRDVPASVVAGVEDTRAVVLAVLSAESFDADWLRPEWLGLAPRLERYWRRRRASRRGFSNPDHGRERRDGSASERGPA